MEYIELNNGVQMPKIMMGTSICDLKGPVKELQKQLEDSIIFGESLKTVGFDTGRDYANEPLLGEIFNRMLSKGICRREDLFITTKVGNGQQRQRNMENEIDISLKNFKLDYIDLWMLHWPLPDYWLDNWEQVVEIYKKGKVRAIGIANSRSRHISALKQAGLKMPHVMQVEYHPFRTIPEFRKDLIDNNIQLEAYSANCLMLPFVKENPVLNEIARNHSRTITQIIMRWHIQQNSIPIFRSFNTSHIKDNVSVLDFELSEEEMQQIFSLNQDYKFHPESLNCPGY